MPVSSAQIVSADLWEIKVECLASRLHTGHIVVATPVLVTGVADTDRLLAGRMDDQAGQLVVRLAIRANTPISLMLRPGGLVVVPPVKRAGMAKKLTSTMAMVMTGMTEIRARETVRMALMRIMRHT